jgi:hypothetical protein
MEKKKIMWFDAGRRLAITTGYGLMSKQFSERLKSLGYELAYNDQEPNFEADIWIWVRPPHYVKYPQFNPNNKNIFFTMHESETLEGWKSDWIELLNKCTAIIVPTEWNKEVFIKLGLTVPCYVVPLGVDEKVFKGLKTANFSLLSVHEAVGKNNSRENWKESLEAYYEVFYNNHYKNVSYTIKSWNIDREGFRVYKEELIKKHNWERELLPEVYLLELEMVEQDLNNLYGQSWAFIKNSFREGWSLPTLEASTTGLRIISRPLGAMPFLNNNNTDFYNSYDELKTKIWENWRRYKKYKADKDQWSWREATKKLDEIIKAIK